MNPIVGFISSRKTLQAIFGSVLLIGGLWIMWSTFTTPDAKRGAFETVVISVAGLWGVNIAGTAHEDAAAKSQPQSQVNVNSDVKNTPTAAVPVATAPTAAPQPVPAAAPFTPEQEYRLTQLVQQSLAAVLRNASALKAKAAAANAQADAVLSAVPPQPIAQQDTIAGAAAVK